MLYRNRNHDIEASLAHTSLIEELGKQNCDRVNLANRTLQQEDQLSQRHRATLLVPFVYPIKLILSYIDQQKLLSLWDTGGQQWLI